MLVLKQDVLKRWSTATHGSKEPHTTLQHMFNRRRLEQSAWCPYSIEPETSTVPRRPILTRLKHSCHNLITVLGKHFYVQIFVGLCNHIFAIIHSVALLGYYPIWRVALQELLQSPNCVSCLTWARVACDHPTCLIGFDICTADSFA